METKARIGNFPCIFNIITSNLANTKRLYTLKEKIKEDLLDDCLPKEEKIQLLNFQTWIEYKLDVQTNFTTAFLINEKSISLGSQNVCTLANQAYLLFFSGDERKALKIVSKLETIKSERFYCDLEKQAFANQAFAYRRLGGSINLSKSRELYEKAICMMIPKDDLIHLYKYQLGVVYRRLGTVDISIHLSENDIDLKKLKMISYGLFKEVADKSSHEILKGRSYAELLFNRDLLSKKEETHFQKKALSYAMRTTCNDVFMLNALGRILPWWHSQKLVVLEKSIHIRETSTACHQLGKLYAGTARNKKLLRYNSRKLHDPIVKIAEKYLKQAVDLCGGMNVPARYHYGLFLKDCFKTEEALRQFNLLINLFEDLECTFYRSKAYEKASECLLSIYHQEKNEEDFIEAKKKIMKAIYISADIAVKRPCMSQFCGDMWKSFKNKDKRRKFSFTDEDILNLVKLIKGHESETLDLINDLLTDDDSDDEKLIAAGLEKYLDIGNFPKAMAFLKLVQTRKSAFETDIWQKDPLKFLALKVQLNSAYDCLINQHTNEAKFIFRSLFTSIYYSESSDVLIVYDDSHDDEDGLSCTTLCARALQKLLADQFHLDVSQNLQVSSLINIYGNKFEVLLWGAL